MATAVGRCLAFLEKGDRDDEKHQDPTHAVVVAVVFYTVVLGTGLATDLALDELLGPLPPPPAAGAAVAGLLAYWSLLLGIRFWLDADGRTAIIYELLWSCTAALVFAAAAAWLGRLALLCASGLLVAIDQVLWYVDIIGYVILGKLPIKVCGYMFWPSTHIAKKVTGLHHLVFVPLVVVLCCRGAGVPLGRGMLISSAQTVASQLVCRFTTPLELPPPPGQDEPRYMNLNLCYEAFKDLKVAWIKCYDRDHPALYLPWMLWIWNAGNYILFTALAAVVVLILRLLSFPGAHFIL